MPFQSKAQQRYMFARHPRIAKRWADKTPNMKKLPEKAVSDKPMNKQGSEGRFFEGRPQSKTGKFFRDLPGREDGDFAKQGMTGMTRPMNVGATGAPMGGSGFRGAGMGDLYGTGDAKKPAEKKPSKKEPEEEKKASRSPSDWDPGTSLPTGFHRPTRTQPEPLESGGGRFHSSEPAQGTGDGIRHGVVEGGRFASKAGRAKMGKHASIQYFGTSFAKQASEPDFGRHPGQMKRSLGRAWDKTKSTADDTLDAVTSSPWASLAAAGGLGLLGYAGLKRGGRGLAKAFKGLKKAPPPPPKPPTLSERMKKALEALQGK